MFLKAPQKTGSAPIWKEMGRPGRLAVFKPYDLLKNARKKKQNKRSLYYSSRKIQRLVIKT